MSETENYRGHTIEIWNDECPLNPRTDWDNGSKMICFHRNYNLGDKHDYNQDDYSSWDELKEAIIENEKPLAILPLYLYDHSGITMNTTGFSCRWDSGCVGFIIVTEESGNVVGWTEEYVQKLSDGDDENYKGKTVQEILENWMVGDVEVYARYLEGAVYGYTDEDGDSCGGYFGYDHEKSGLLPDARASIDGLIQRKREARFEKLKQYIKSGVPVIYRTLPSL